MDFRKIFEGQITSLPSGASNSIALKPRGGGRMVKNVLYMIKVNATDGSANNRISLELRHSPDGTVSAPFGSGTDIVNSVNPGTTIPALVGGDSGAYTQVLGEFLHVILKIAHANGGSGSQVWAQVEVFEMRKPF